MAPMTRGFGLLGIEGRRLVRGPWQTTAAGTYSMDQVKLGRRNRTSADDVEPLRTNSTDSTTLPK
jgi:hypothetical protein